MSALRQLWADAEMKALNCSVCGVEFCMTSDYIAARRRDCRTWYCPNGHSQWYPGKTEEERQIEALKAQVAAAEREAVRARQARSWAESQAHGARTAAGKAKAAKRKMEHRVSCGVCPHCKRTFKQLAAHMKSKHPKVLKR